ncbi:MAG: AarF/ABC1/UbiB kinase family protein, partial [Aeriscardovia sp.]|nr:AarF/ABC1/UbiB kinase family protein [Aeriscardovia sp.]
MSPEKLCKILQALGPTFVKVGQILSMRSEILPQAYCEALASLRSHADPMPYSTVLNTLEHEYGRNLSEIFDFIDRKPLGSASVAQVHYAKLVTGESVAVKVQRPGVREMMAQDIAIIRSVVKFAMRIGKDSQLFDLKGVVEEIWTSFRMETDFLVEARNLQEFREFTDQFAYMDCPKVYMSLCTHKVVVMDYIQGIPLA